jgi:hypothetical protein
MVERQGSSRERPDSAGASTFCTLLKDRDNSEAEWAAECYSLRQRARSSARRFGPTEIIAKSFCLL